MTERKDIKVVMVGLGYIGLPTAALMAAKGIRVRGVDINPKVVETINKGDIHIVEPDLDGLVRHAVDTGLLIADTKPAEADVFLIAVPTPFRENHEPDVSYVEAAAKAIVPYLREGNLVVIESTSPVGTTERAAELIYSERPELKGKMFIAYCPERVLPGRVIYELEHNDRVIGGLDEASTARAVQFYSGFVKGQLHPAGARTGVMCKLVENSYRDVNIAFANELSMICDKADINVWELIRLANRHPRVNILQPGVGVGGHCIAVDPWFLVHDYPEEAQLIRKAREVNLRKTEWVVEKIVEAAREFEAKEGRKPKIACLGLAFKPDIDDLRGSPAVEVVKTLQKKGHEVMAVEPNIKGKADFELYDIEEAGKQADIVVLQIKHGIFKHIEIVVVSNRVLDYCGALAGV